MVNVGGHSDAGTGTWFMSNQPLSGTRHRHAIIWCTDVYSICLLLYTSLIFVKFESCVSSPCHIWYICTVCYIYIIYIHITFWVADARNPQVCQCASIPRPSIWWRSRSLLLERPCEDQSLKTLKELRVNGSFSSLWTLLLQGLVLEKILDVEKMTAEWGPLQTIVSLCFPHSRPSVCLLVFLLTFWNCWQSRNQLRIPYRGGWKREEAWQRFSSEVTLVSNHL